MFDAVSITVPKNPMRVVGLMASGFSPITYTAALGSRKKARFFQSVVLATREFE
jgi:hypothetical protein